MKPEHDLPLAVTGVAPDDRTEPPSGAAGGGRSSGFWNGGLAGVALAGLIAQLWFAEHAGAYRRVYDDAGSILERPFVLSAWWLCGASGVQALGLAALVVRRPRRIWWYAGAAALAAACIVLTWWLTVTPLRELAGELKG
jgi:hypothetical protein